jgi:hypothetical protein
MTRDTDRARCVRTVDPCNKAWGKVNPTLLRDVVDQPPWLGQPERADELLEEVVRLDPALFVTDVKAWVDFFNRRFRETVAAVEQLDTPSR